MIASVSYSTPAPGTGVIVTFADGSVWHTDAALPPDTDIRRALAAWVSGGGVIAPYVAPPAPVPESITRRQCARELFARGMISGPELVAMTQTGAPPAMIENLFDVMPEPSRSIALADFAADSYVRTNPLLVDFMVANGASASDIDDFFRGAAAR